MIQDTSFTTEELVRIIGQVVVDTSGIDPAFTCLFGSAARGESISLSDVDVGVYQDVDMDLMTLGELTGRLEDALGRSVDVLELRGLWNRKPALAFAVTRDMVPVTVRDNEALVHFKKWSMLYFMDTQYLRDLTGPIFEKRVRSGRMGLPDRD